MNTLLARIHKLERRIRSLENSLYEMRKSRDKWRARAGAKPHGSPTTWHRKPGRPKKVA